MKSIAPGRINGLLTAPASKSLMQRAVAAAALAQGTTQIRNPSFSEDGKAALRIARALGAEVSEGVDAVVIQGGKPLASNVFDCGESGLSFRLFCAIAALYDKEITMVARGSLLARPMDMVIDTLRAQGVRVSCASHHPPFTIAGPLHGGTIEVDGAASSQFVSGLLMALPLCKEDSVLRVSNLASADYVLLTLDILRHFGIVVESSGDRAIYQISGRQQYRALDYVVEGDWSGAAFLLVAGAIGGSMVIDGLSMVSHQADRRIVDALRLAGAHVNVDNNSVVVEKRDLTPFEFDANDCPDLFPPLVALASYASGVTKVRGVGRLRHKESNRALALMNEFGSIGIQIEIEGDMMFIHGGRVFGGSAHSHGDHRIAMAIAVAAMGADASVSICEPQAVNKSYERFYEDLDSARCRI